MRIPLSRTTATTAMMGNAMLVSCRLRANRSGTPGIIRRRYTLGGEAAANASHAYDHALRPQHVRYVQEGAQLARPTRRAARIHRLPRASDSGGDAEGLRERGWRLGQARQSKLDDVAEPARGAALATERSGVDAADQGISGAGAQALGRDCRWRRVGRVYRQGVCEVVRVGDACRRSLN